MRCSSSERCLRLLRLPLCEWRGAGALQQFHRLAAHLPAAGLSHHSAVSGANPGAPGTAHRYDRLPAGSGVQSAHRAVRVAGGVQMKNDGPMLIQPIKGSGDYG
jgi:hypothetical protein